MTQQQGYERTRGVPAYIEVDGAPLCRREGHTCGLLNLANSREAVNERGFPLTCGYRSLTAARLGLSVVRKHRSGAKVVRGFCPEGINSECRRRLRLGWFTDYSPAGTMGDE